MGSYLPVQEDVLVAVAFPGEAGDVLKLHRFACHPCAGAMLTDLCHSSFCICAAKVSTRSSRWILLEVKKLNQVMS